MLFVLVAASADYKLYNYSFHPLNLALVKSEENEGVREQRGQFVNIHEDSTEVHEHHGSHASPHHLKEVSIDKFAQDIAKMINHDVEQAKINHKEYKLILVAGPHMNGLINKHLNEEAKNHIKLNLHKDLINFSDHELLDYLQEHKFG